MARRAARHELLVLDLDHRPDRDPPGFDLPVPVVGEHLAARRHARRHPEHDDRLRPRRADVPPDDLDDRLFDPLYLEHVGGSAAAVRRRASLEHDTLATGRDDRLVERLARRSSRRDRDGTTDR